MINDFLEIVANDVANKGKYIKVSPNSLFAGLAVSNDDEATLNLYAKKMAEKVTREINYIRNTIKPVYSDVLKYIDENASKFDKPTLSDKLSIVEFAGSVFFEELKKHGGNIGNVRPLSTAVPFTNINGVLPEEPGELNRIFTYDDSALHILAEPALKRLGEKQLEMIYTSIVNCNYFGPGGLVANIAEDVFDNLDKLTAAYILAVNLQRLPKPVYIVADELGFKKTMTWLVEELANLIAKALKDADKFKTAGVVILGINGKQITVLKSNYDSFLEQGGTPETILGFSLIPHENRSRADTFIQALLNKKVVLEANWNKLVEMEKLDQANVDIAKYRALYSATVQYALQNIIPGKILELNKTTPAEVAEKFMEYVNDLEPLKLINKERVVSKLIGKYVFDYEPFEFITKAMIAYGELTDQPAEITIKYAALEYVMEYLLDQVTAEKAEFKLQA